MKKKILVLCGGISKERLISLDTGKQVANELKKNKYKVITAEPDDTLLKNIKLFIVSSTLLITFWNWADRPNEFFLAVFFSNLYVEK